MGHPWKYITSFYILSARGQSYGTKELQGLLGNVVSQLCAQEEKEMRFGKYIAMFATKRNQFLLN